MQRTIIFDHRGMPGRLVAGPSDNCLSLAALLIRKQVPQITIIRISKTWINMLSSRISWPTIILAARTMLPNMTPISSLRPLTPLVHRSTLTRPLLTTPQILTTPQMAWQQKRLSSAYRSTVLRSWILRGPVRLSVAWAGAAGMPGYGTIKRSPWMERRSLTDGVIVAG